MIIVSRYHHCQLEVWVELSPAGKQAHPIFLNVLRQPITSCPRCGQLLAWGELHEARLLSEDMPVELAPAVPEATLRVAYAR